MGRKVLEKFAFSPLACRVELRDFEQLLQRDELSEGQDILPFFETHSHLSSLIGMLNRSIGRIDLLAHEYDIFGDFRSDLVVGDSARFAYTLVEFEDARQN